MNPYAEHLFLIYELRPQGDKLQHRLAGKIYIPPTGMVQVLENHHLPFPTDLIEGETGARFMETIVDSMHFAVVNLASVLRGEHSDLLSDLVVDLEGLTPDAKRSVEYEYHRIGQPAPQQLLVHHDGRVLLDGHQLSEPEIARVKESIQGRRAVLRGSSGTPIAKSDGWKPDPHLGMDHHHSQVHNLHSLRSWQGTIPLGGAHMAIALRRGHEIADEHGFGMAEKAVASLIKHVTGATGEAVGHSNAPIFRVGAHQLAIHVPTVEHAMGLMRNLRHRLEKLPMIGGKDLLAVSIGIDKDHEGALRACGEAHNVDANGGQVMVVNNKMH